MIFLNFILSFYVCHCYLNHHFNELFWGVYNSINIYNTVYFFSLMFQDSELGWVSLPLLSL